MEEKRRIKKIESEFLFSLELKYCSKCGQIKELDKFNKNKSFKDGLASWCKECSKKYRQSKKGKKAIKEYYESNKKEIKESQKKYFKNNKEKIKKSRKEYFKNNKENRKKYQKEYRESNKENIKKYQKEYRQSERGKKVKKKYKQQSEPKKKILIRGQTNREWGTASTHLCAYCKQKAAQWHHQRYDSRWREGCVPLCLECHQMICPNKKQLTNY